MPTFVISVGRVMASGARGPDYRPCPRQDSDCQNSGEADDDDDDDDDDDGHNSQKIRTLVCTSFNSCSSVCIHFFMPKPWWSGSDSFKQPPRSPAPRRLEQSKYFQTSRFSWALGGCDPRAMRVRHVV